jgi:outer membrane protein OmpA-like peptidoglycan-associated protein
MVTFEPDRTVITDGAAATIRKAAADVKAGHVTSIGISRERSGSGTYDVALSMRRVNAIKDKLRQEGIPASLAACGGELAHGPTEPGKGFVAIFVM